MTEGGYDYQDSSQQDYIQYNSYGAHDDSKGLKLIGLKDGYIQNDQSGYQAMGQKSCGCGQNEPCGCGQKSQKPITLTMKVMDKGGQCNKQGPPPKQVMAMPMKQTKGLGGMYQKSQGCQKGYGK